MALSWSFVGARSDVTYDDFGAFENGSGRVAAFNIGALSMSFDVTDQAQIFARIDNLANASYEQPAAFAGAPRSVQIGVRGRY